MNAAYGLYLDANLGFKQVLEMLNKAQAKSAETTDESAVFYGIGAPTDPGNILLHQTTQGTLKQRISKGGRHYLLLGRLLIVLLFELWETGYRTDLATAAGVPRDHLLVSVFGDLRLLRHDILHKKGRLVTETLEKLEVISAPESGFADFDEDGVHTIIRQIKTAVDELVFNFAGEDPKYRTVFHVV